MNDPSHTVTALLRGWRHGDAAARDQLMPMVYEELHRLALHYLRLERPGHTFRPTDLVSEAYLRLASGAQPDWEDRAHFFGISARIMRQILVDHARKRAAGKRGAGERPITLDEAVASTERPEQLIALDHALEELARFDERKARVIELHYFGGLTQPEMAEVLALHVNTIARELRLAEAWIHRQIAAL